MSRTSGKTKAETWGLDAQVRACAKAPALITPVLGFYGFGVGGMPDSVGDWEQKLEEKRKLIEQALAHCEPDIALAQSLDAIRLYAAARSEIESGLAGRKSGPTVAALDHTLDCACNTVSELARLSGTKVPGIADAGSAMKRAGGARGRKTEADKTVHKVMRLASKVEPWSGSDTGTRESIELARALVSYLEKHHGELASAYVDVNDAGNLESLAKTTTTAVRQYPAMLVAAGYPDPRLRLARVSINAVALAQAMLTSAANVLTELAALAGLDPPAFRNGCQALRAAYAAEPGDCRAVSGLEWPEIDKELPGDTLERIQYLEEADDPHDTGLLWPKTGEKLSEELRALDDALFRAMAIKGVNIDVRRLNRRLECLRRIDGGPGVQAGDYALEPAPAKVENQSAGTDKAANDSTTGISAQQRYAFRKTSAGFETWFEYDWVDQFPITVGMRCLHVLLSNPGIEFDATELNAKLNPPPPGKEEYRDGFQQPKIDPKTRGKVMGYRKECSEMLRGGGLTKEKQDAIHKAIAESEDYLEAATGGHPSGRNRYDRHFGNKKYTRGNYQKKIKDAIKTIGRKNKEAGDYLGKKITRGMDDVFNYHGGIRWLT